MTSSEEATDPIAAAPTDNVNQEPTAAPAMTQEPEVSPIESAPPIQVSQATKEAEKRALEDTVRKVRFAFSLNCTPESVSVAKTIGAITDATTREGSDIVLPPKICDETFEREELPDQEDSGKPAKKKPRVDPEPSEEVMRAAQQLLDITEEEIDETRQRERDSEHVRHTLSTEFVMLPGDMYAADSTTTERQMKTMINAFGVVGASAERRIIDLSKKVYVNIRRMIMSIELVKKGHYMTYEHYMEDFQDFYPTTAAMLRILCDLEAPMYKEDRDRVFLFVPNSGVHTLRLLVNAIVPCDMIPESYLYHFKGDRYVLQCHQFTLTEVMQFPWELHIQDKMRPYPPAQ